MTLPPPAPLDPEEEASRQLRVVLGESLGLTQRRLNAAQAIGETCTPLLTAAATAEALLLNPLSRAQDLMEGLADLEAQAQLLALPEDKMSATRDCTRLHELLAKLQSSCEKKGAETTAAFAEANEIHARLSAQLSRSRDDVGRKLARDVEIAGDVLSRLAARHHQAEQAAQDVAVETIVATGPACSRQGVGAQLQRLLDGGPQMSTSAGALPEDEVVLSVDTANEERMLNGAMLQSWTSAPEAEEEEALARLACDAQALVQLHRTVAEMAETANDCFATAEANTASAVADTSQATGVIGEAAKTKSRFWGLTASVGNGVAFAAVGGAAVGLPGAVGLGVVGAGVGAVIGKTVKKRHERRVSAAVAAAWDTREGLHRGRASPPPAEERDTATN